jgi:UDP-galactopyranose mutase
LALTKQTKSLIAISLAMAAKFLVVGAGFSGCVIANQLVQLLDCTVDIVDERPHLGGNCHTDRDEETGVMVHHYGPHIFNTDKKYIWDFVNQFETLCTPGKSANQNRHFPTAHQLANHQPIL